MEFFCLMLTVFGLIICFGGIYIKKFCSSIMGLIWGAIIAAILIVLTTESIWQVDTEESLVWIFLGAITFAIISAVQEKVCAFLNSAMPVFFFVSVFMIFNALFEDGVEMSAIFVVALMVAVIAGWIACVFYVVSFMLETAFTGAFIASLGIYGLSESANDFGDLIFGALRDDEMAVYLFFGTLILGIIGFCVQWRRFIAIKEEKAAKSDNSNWICECGAKNANDYQFCESCGKKRIALARTVTASDWICECGNANTPDTIFCSECEKKRIVIHQANSTWLCSCGTTNEEDMAFCSECGKPHLEANASTPWICSNCGTENEADYIFCTNCKTTCGGKKE